jgi:exportin-7
VFPAPAADAAGSDALVAVPERPAPFQVSHPRAAQVLEVLTLFVSVRRSLFATDQDRRRFLLLVMAGISDVMRGKIVSHCFPRPLQRCFPSGKSCDVQGMGDSDCYHNFCRLLGRLKANYQLSELVKTEGYEDWLRLAAEFAIQSFQQMSVRSFIC